MPKGNMIGDKLATYAADIADLKTLLDLNIRKYYYELNRLNRYIASVDDSLTRMIMTLRFINGLSWRQVAYSVGGNNTDENVKKIAYRYINKNLSRMSRTDVVK